MSHRHHLIGLIAAALLLGAGASRALAVTEVYHWDANGALPPDGIYNDPLNWYPDGGGPDYDDSAIFDLDQTYTVTFTTSRLIGSLSLVGDVTMTSDGSLRTYEPTVGVWVGGTLTVDNLVLSPYDLLEVYHPDGASLLIRNGGQVEITAPAPNCYGRIGYPEERSGEVIVDGAGSSWVSDTLHIGDYGSGSLTIRNGGYVWNDSGAYLGYWGASGYGAAIVEGVGSQWQVGNAHVGGLGTGSVAVSNGGTLNASGTVWVNDTGAVELLGGQITAGSFLVDPAGTFTHTGGTLTVDGGTFDPGTTDYTIDGPGNPTLGLINGASASLSSDLYVADANQGTLILQSGATFSNTYGWIGFAGGSDGQVSVDGASSTWTNTELLYVGRSGSGTLTITNGASVSSIAGFLGLNTGSSGTVTVSGMGSTWTNTGFSLLVGCYGTGVLEITSGASVANTTYGSIGVQSGSSGEVTVDGGSWTNGSSLDVGHLGSGTLTVSNGGTVSDTDGRIGYASGSDGTVTVTGPGSTWTNTSSLYVGGGSGAAGGTGELTVDNGTVSVAGTLKVWGTGTVYLNGGTLTAGSIDHTAGGAFNFTGGRLHVGTFMGNLTNNGGSLWPGASAGTTTIQGDYIQAVGALQIELGGTTPGTEYDVLEVTGAATLGGMLVIWRIDAFTPQVGDEFEIVTYASRTGEFTGTVGWLFDDKALVKVYGPNDLTLFATYRGDANLSQSVDLLDLTILAGNWQQSPRTWFQGDFTGDWVVNLLDLTILAGNWQAGAGQAAVPAPATLGLIVAGAAWIFRRRRP